MRGMLITSCFTAADIAQIYAAVCHHFCSLRYTFTIGRRALEPNRAAAIDADTFSRRCVFLRQVSRHCQSAVGHRSTASHRSASPNGVQF